MSVDLGYKPKKIQKGAMAIKKRKLKLCREKGCKNLATTESYCRVHYLKNWQKIKAKAKERAIKNLNKYIDHIMHKHPEGYMDKIREDLQDFDAFQKKAENFKENGEDGFHDIMDELSRDDVARVISNIKVDDSF